MALLVHLTKKDQADSQTNHRRNNRDPLLLGMETSCVIAQVGIAWAHVSLIDIKQIHDDYRVKKKQSLTLFLPAVL